jgi:hypothetical protein
VIASGLNVANQDSASSGLLATLKWSFNCYLRSVGKSDSVRCEQLVLKRNEREADMWMENIKETLEV